MVKKLYRGGKIYLDAITKVYLDAIIAEKVI